MGLFHNHLVSLKQMMAMGLLLSSAICTLNGCVAFLPEGPFEFVGETKPFFFDKVGNVERFNLEISDMSKYEMALIAEDTGTCIFPSGSSSGVIDNAPLQWRLDVSVWYRGEMVEHRIFEGVMAGELFDSDRNCLEILQLGLLTSLKSLIGTKRFIVTVSVLAVDERYTDRTIPVRVGIRRSPRI